MFHMELPHVYPTADNTARIIYSPKCVVEAELSTKAFTQNLLSINELTFLKKVNIVYHLKSSNALLSNALEPCIILLHKIYYSFNKHANLEIWLPGWEVTCLFEVQSVKQAIYSLLREVLNYQK